jgi:hypothetical protein
MKVQKHYKKRCTKQILQKRFHKKIDTKPATDFFDDFFITFFGVSRCERGVQKHDKKISKKINLTLVLFWPLRNQPTTTTPRPVKNFLVPRAP